MGEYSNSKLGRISLISSLLGVVTPILVVFISKTFVEADIKSGIRVGDFILSVGWVWGVEMIAFIFGILGRSSPKGKVGLCISSLLLGAFFLFVLYIMWSLIF